MFKAKCSKCGAEFESQPGELNSTKYLGEASVIHGAGGFLPECSECGNWRGNQLVKNNGQLSKPMRF